LFETIECPGRIKRNFSPGIGTTGGITRFLVFLDLFKLNFGFVFTKPVGVHLDLGSGTLRFLEILDLTRKAIGSGSGFNEILNYKKKKIPVLF